MIILIPPSEGKSSGGDCKPLRKLSGPSVKIYDKLCKEQNEKLLGVKGKVLEQALQDNKTILTQKTMPAIKRYTGVVYDGLDYESLNSKEKKYVDSNVKIVSALFGLVSPKDYIPNYKLKIDKLGVAKLWKGENVINEFVIDLLPQAHKKAVTYENGVEVEFVIEKNGKKIAAGHNGKLVKGKFIRWLAQNNISKVEDFKKFKEDGFVWTNNVFFKKI